MSVVTPWEVIEQFDSSETTVSKYVFSQDNAVAEAVLYKYPSFRERTVICCSTQSGCPVGCGFCGTGEHFVRSLTAEEITSQVEYLLETQIDMPPEAIENLQVMFMSMGEPMLNFEELSKAIRHLAGIYPHAALLISTMGPKAGPWEDLRKLSRDIEQIGLQFSVHESTDKARDKLIPFKGKLTLKEISSQGSEWHKATQRRPFFNYCVHSDNNAEDDVARLKALFDPNMWEATISVICEANESVSVAHDRQQELASSFMDKMLASGFSTRMFDPAGQDDIGGGCGQLWYVQDWMADNPQHVKVSIGGR